MYQITLKQLPVTFLAPPRLLTNANPSHDRDVRQQAGVLPLFLFFVTCVFDDFCTTYSVTHHCNNHVCNAIFFVVSVSQSNQGHTAKKKIPPRLYHCITLLS